MNCQVEKEIGLSECVAGVIPPYLVKKKNNSHSWESFIDACKALYLAEHTAIPNP